MSMTATAKDLSKKKGGSFYILVFGIVFGLVAAFGVIQIINQATSAVPVVKATEKIAPFTRINKTQVTVEMVARSAFKEGMMNNVEAVWGRVSKTEIPAGWPVSEESLAQNTPGSALTAQISEKKNPNLRAVPLKIDNITNFSGKLTPGDRVDVIGAMKLPVNGGVQLVTKIIASNVDVIDVGRNGDKNIEEAILAITPQQAQELKFAESSGTISLLINPYETDVNAANTSPTTSYSFVTKMLSGNTPQPAENK